MTTMMLALLGSSSSTSPEVFLSGVSANGSVGFVGSQGGVSFAAVGVAAAGQVGVITQSGNASATVSQVTATGSIGQVDAVVPASLPEGTILLFDRSSVDTPIPAGFSLYTEQGGQSVTGFLIKGGTVVSRSTGTPAPVSYSGSSFQSGSAGAHGPGLTTTSIQGAGQPSTPINSRTRYNAEEGVHSHTIFISPSPGGTINYPTTATFQGTSVPLIRASSETAAIPANAVVFGTSSGGFTGFSSKSWSVNGVYSIASSINVNNPSPTSIGGSFTVVTSEDGIHSHGQTVVGTAPSPAGPGPWTDANGFSGGHTHPASLGQLGVWKQYKHLLPFVCTSSSTVQSGMIVMYNGVSVPSGWNLCDGTNGTPNMVNFFLGFNSGSSGGALVGRDLIGATGPSATTPAPSPTAYGTTSVPVNITSVPWSHTHLNNRNVERQTTSYNALHGTVAVPHTHTASSVTFDMPSAYMPQNLTLIFIQKS